MKGRSLHVCAGTSELGDVRVDLEPRAPGVIRADMYRLPFADESFDTVIANPPWRINWFDRWKAFFELVRCTKVHADYLQFLLFALVEAGKAVGAVDASG